MDYVEKIIEEATASSGVPENQGTQATEKTDTAEPEVQDGDANSKSGEEETPLEAVLNDLEDGEPEEPEDGEPEEPEDGEPEPKPRKNSSKSVSKRIKHYRDRAVEAETELAALRSAATKQTHVDTHKDKPDKQYNPPKREDYAINEEYVDAKIKYEVDFVREETKKDVFAAIKEKGDLDTQEAIAKKKGEVMRVKGDEFSEKYPDFWELSDATKYSDVTADFLVESDKGAAIAYVLAKSPKLSAKILAMPPITQIRELVKLENKLRGSGSASVSTTTPITPIKGGRNAGTAKKLYDSISDSEIQDFIKKAKTS